MEQKPGRPTRDPSGKAGKLFPVRLTDAERAQYEHANVLYARRIT